MGKNAAIYCRVSTQQQTTDRQKIELLQYAKDNCIHIDNNHLYIDNISGFKKGEYRPEYSKMKEEVEKGNINMILFSEFTRLARNANELLDEINYFRKKGIELYFQKQNQWIKNDKLDVGTTILLHVLAVVAEYEIELFTQRTIGGKIIKVKQGHNIGGFTAYGYMSDDSSKLIINQEEAIIIQRIFNSYIDGKSSLEIAEELNIDKVPSPYAVRLKQAKEKRVLKGEKEKIYKHYKAELLWRPSTINRLVKNELYIGKREVVFHEADPTNPEPIHKRTVRKILDSVSYIDESLRIIDDDIFNMVNEIISNRAYNRNLGIKHDVLLKHLMKCGECGANFSVGKQMETSTNYLSCGRTYKCYGRVNRKDKPQTCKDGAELRQWKMDGLVLQLSIKMFANIDIEKSMTQKIDILKNEIEELHQWKIKKELDFNETTEQHKRVIKRMFQFSEEDSLINKLLNEEVESFKKKKLQFEDDMQKTSKNIVYKINAIQTLTKIKENDLLKNKMDDIWNDRELVKTMINEYIDNILVYRIHPRWLLVVVKYKNNDEMWGTIKSARYKKDEMFYDEMLCRHGIEFKAWMLSNSEGCFFYNPTNKKIYYNGESEIYKEFKKGEYDYNSFNEMIEKTNWMGSFPFYDFEKKSMNQNNVNDKKNSELTKYVDWNIHNEEVLNKLNKMN